MGNGMDKLVEEIKHRKYGWVWVTGGIVGFGMCIIFAIILASMCLLIIALLPAMCDAFGMCLFLYPVTAPATTGAGCWPESARRIMGETNGVSITYPLRF